MSEAAASLALDDDFARAVAWLRSPDAVRQRAHQMLALAEAGQLQHFAVDLERLDAVAELVLDVTRQSYPDLKVPYHSRLRQFSAGGVDRLSRFDAALSAAGADPAERARALFDLIVTSVLLDAGAGAAWRYVEPATGRTFARSEGLAVASFDLFMAGGLSSDPRAPRRADAAGLAAFTADALARAFRVTPDNPLVGLDGRVGLLQRLGQVMAADPVAFPTGRPGDLADALMAQAVDGRLPASRVLAAVLQRFGDIWPGRITLGGANLGDVWRHPGVRGDGPTDGLVPFHKLSQWLSYSLIEALELAGLRVTDMDALTGLAEYRNGGLFVDGGVLVPRHDGVLGQAHPPESTVIVEWRALTVALLDRVAERVRTKLGLTAEQLPLARVLEGGTWATGRRLASQRRSDGAPPIALASDGTVF